MVIKPLRAALFVTIALVAAPAAAQWKHATSSVDCNFRQVFPNGSDLEFGLNRKLDYGTLILWNDSWSSIRDDKEYPIRIDADGVSQGGFVGRGMIATGVPGGGIIISVRPKASLERMAASGKISFWRDDNLIGHFPMTGAHSAFRQASACVAAGKGSDPFS